MDRKELAQFLFDNFYDANTNRIRISGLDFRKFKCDVCIGSMQVDGDLYQDYQEANYIEQRMCRASIIDQSEQRADKILQFDCMAEVIYQGEHYATKIEQENLEAKEIYQGNQTAEKIVQEYLDADEIVMNLSKLKIEEILGCKIKIIEEDK